MDKIEIFVWALGAIQALAVTVIVPLVKARFRGLDESIAAVKSDAAKAEDRLHKEIAAIESRHGEFYRTFEQLKIDLAEIKTELKIIRQGINGQSFSHPSSRMKS